MWKMERIAVRNFFENFGVILSFFGNESWNCGHVENGEDKCTDLFFFQVSG
jgi:hypothetical protein